MLGIGEFRVFAVAGETGGSAGRSDLDVIARVVWFSHIKLVGGRGVRQVFRGLFIGLLMPVLEIFPKGANCAIEF